MSFYDHHHEASRMALGISGLGRNSESCSDLELLAIPFILDSFLLHRTFY